MNGTVLQRCWNLLSLFSSKEREVVCVQVPGARLRRTTVKRAAAGVFLVFMVIAVAGPAGAANCISAGDGNWTAITWTNCTGNPGGDPAAGDTVTIRNGDDVTLDTTTTVAGIIVGQGTSGRLTLGNGNGDVALTVSGNIAINAGGTFNTTGNGGNVLNVTGNVSNAGTLDMRIGGATANTTFNGAVNQTVSGTGGTTDFNRITINNTGAANNDIVEIASSNFTAAAGFLTLTNGVLKMSGSYTFSNTFFNTTSYTIPAAAGIWLNNPNVTVTAQNGTVTLNGLLQIDAGICNIGTTNAHRIQYGTGATFIMGGGALNLSGGFSPVATANTISYTQSGGTFTLATQGTDSTTLASFDINNAGSSFTMSGGTIVLQRMNARTYSDYRNIAGTVAITGGTVEFGNGSTPASQIYWIGYPGGPANVIPDMVVNGTNSPIVRTKVATTVFGGVTIDAGATLDWNGQNIALSGDWSNSGTFLNTGTAGVGTVTFNGGSAQTIGGSATTAFNNLTASNAAGVTLNRSTTVTNALAVTLGTFDQGSANNLIAGSISVSSGATFENSGTGSITLNGNLANEGTIVIDGSGGGCNTADTKITVTATAARTWSGDGAYRLTDVDLTNQTAAADLPAGETIAVFHGTATSSPGFTASAVCTGAPAFPTAVTLISFGATEYDGRVLLQWRTGHEVDNLGFHLYREVSGVRTRITPQLVAGSALIAGPGAVLTAGRPYAWWDDRRRCHVLARGCRPRREAEAVRTDLPDESPGGDAGARACADVEPVVGGAERERRSRCGDVAPCLEQRQRRRLL